MSYPTGEPVLGGAVVVLAPAGLDEGPAPGLRAAIRFYPQQTTPISVKADQDEDYARLGRLRDVDSH